jgi:AcrR family transcriptional regulator
MTHPERPSPDQRRSGRSRNRRDDILRAALGVFAERGYRGASLAAVAERVGLTQQGLLHYFPNKETLLVEVLRIRDELDIGRITVGPATLSHLAELVAYNATRPDIVQSFTVLSAESVTEGHPARAFLVKRYAESRRTTAESLRAELGTRLPAGLSVEQAAALLLAIIDGLQLQWLLQPDEIDMPALFDLFVDLLRGTTPPRDA